MLRIKFNPAAGWLYVFHDAPFIVPFKSGDVMMVPPGLGELHREFYGARIKVAENEKFPA